MQSNGHTHVMSYFVLLGPLPHSSPPPAPALQLVLAPSPVSLLLSYHVKSITFYFPPLLSLLPGSDPRPGPMAHKHTHINIHTNTQLRI